MRHRKIVTAVTLTLALAAGLLFHAVSAQAMGRRGRASTAARAPGGRAKDTVAVYRQRLRGPMRTMAAIARNPDIATDPIIDHYLRGNFWFDAPPEGFAARVAGKAIGALSRAKGGTWYNTYELREPRSNGRVLGYYVQISTRVTRRKTASGRREREHGFHVFTDVRGQQVTSTPFVIDNRI